MEKAKVYIKIFLDYLIAGAVLLFVIFALPKLIGFFLPFVIGWIISMIANPLVKFLESKVKIVRKHSSALIIIGVLALIVAVIYGIILVLYQQISSLLTNMPEIYAWAEIKLHVFMQNIEKIVDFLPGNFKLGHGNIDSLVLEGLQDIGKRAGNFTISDAGDVVKNVLESLFIAIITILSAYFFIADKEKISKTMHEHMPKSIMDKWQMVKENFAKALGGYFKAQFKIMIVIYIILFVFFEFFGVPYSALIALIVAFLDFLPFFGTGTVLGPWAIVDIICANYTRGIAIIALYLVCQVVRNILQPKMVGDSVGLNPLATLFFMFVGYRFGGLFGLIIGIPIGMILINLYKSGVFDHLIKDAKIVARDIREFGK
ncbi:MAG: sporulation integral membrane protein YtvI [Lachnospiraceae bacterium]|nr:sporulation integral membrane protein YtvI [Lachnospiraceae bacterium]